MYHPISTSDYQNVQLKQLQPGLGICTDIFQTLLKFLLLLHHLIIPLKQDILHIQCFIQKSL